MKSLVLILALLWTATARAELSMHEAAVHNLAHFGAGCIAWGTAGLFCNVTGLSKSHPVIATAFELAVPVLAGLAKEAADSKAGGGFNWSQAGSTAAAGPAMLLATFKF